MVAEYMGQTGQNAYSQGLEHQNRLRNEDESSPLWKHCTIQHEHRKVDLKMDVIQNFKHPLIRQSNEGVRVKYSKAPILLNSKSEFHQPSVVRFVAMRGNINEEQTGPNRNKMHGEVRWPPQELACQQDQEENKGVEK